MVRFSTVIFWLSFISETDSVGTTIWRMARCCPSDTTRCSRLCLTLFSWPEYVFTTYQRNMLEKLSPLPGQDEIHKVPGQGVGHAEEDARHDHEPDDDPRGLHHLAAVRPLYSLELAPASSQEVDQASARRLTLRGGGAARHRNLTAV